MQRIVNSLLGVGLLVSLGLNVLQVRGGHEATTHLRPNVQAGFNPTVERPRVGAGTYIDPLATVIGNVRLGRRSMVAPFASIRGDEGQPIRLGSRTNVQDGVVIHALESMDGGAIRENNLVEHNGRMYAVYIGDEVSLAHQSQVHGPAKVGDGTFIGMQALVFRAEIGEGCVLEPAAKVIGVKVEPGRYVPAGVVVTTQAQADTLPVITQEYVYRALNDGMIRVNTQLADGYLGNGRVYDGERAPQVEISEQAARPSPRPETRTRPRAATSSPTSAERTATARPASATPATGAGSARH